MFSRLVFLVFSSFSFSAPAVVVRHILLPHDSAFSVQTQHACSTYLHQPSPHWCNPALFSFANQAPIKADLALNANNDAYETTNRFLNQPIDKDFIDHLFKEKDFQSFSGLARLEAMSSYLSFSYIPAYLVGVYQLSNPNLPEVSAAGVRESQVRVTSGILLGSLGNWQVYGGGTATLFDRKMYTIHANVLALVVQKVETLVHKNREGGLNADLGLLFKDNLDRLPAISVSAENIFATQHDRIGEDALLDLEPNFRRRLRIGSGYTFSHVTGTYHLGLHLPFWGLGSSFDRYGASVALVHGIGRLRNFVSFSPFMTAFGFVFMSPHYHIGIQYTNDKQDNSLELRRKNNVYLFASFAF